MLTRLRGIVRTAELIEEPAGSDRFMLLIEAQGVGPGQPRKLTIPHELLMTETWIDPDQVIGHGFEATVEQQSDGRWFVVSLSIAARRVLRDP